MSRSIASSPGAAAAVAALVLMLSACRDAQQSSMPSTEDPAAPTSATGPVEAAPAPMPEEAQAMPGPTTTIVPDDVVVSTNEPFWNARVEDGEVVLTGAGQPERRLTVESAQVTGDFSTIRASDANGNLLIEVRSEACQDSMSGAEYPFTGSLAFDGGAAIMGCARPASMPTPGEPGAEGDDDRIPVAFHGRWAPDAQACAKPASSIEGVTIAAGSLRFHESTAVPTVVEQVDQDTVRVTAEYRGEGQQWSAVRTLELLGGGRLAITADGSRVERVRCGG